MYSASIRDIIRQFKTMKVKLGEIKIPKVGNMRIWSQDEFAEIETSVIEVSGEKETLSALKPPTDQGRGDEEKIILEELEKLKREEQKVAEEITNEEQKFKKEISHQEQDQFDQAPQVADHTSSILTVPLNNVASDLDEGSGHKVLFRVKSIFPFDPFPDELIIEETRIVFKHRVNPFAKRVFSMLIKDISQSRLSTSIFFGKILIQDIFGENEISIDYLSKKKAYLVKGILDRLQARERRRVAGVPAESVKKILSEESQEKENFIDTGW